MQQMIKAYLTGWNCFLLRSDCDCSTLIVCAGDSIWDQRKKHQTDCALVDIDCPRLMWT